MLGARLSASLALVALSLVSTSCRYLRDDEGIFVDPRDDYLEAQVGEPLTIPPDMTNARIVDSWPIPEVRAGDAAKNFPEGPPRPEVFVGGNTDAVKIQKLGDRSWVVLPDAPEQVWPLIKQFLAENGVAVARENAPTGLVESAWIVIVDRDYEDVVRGTIAEGQREAASNRPAAQAGAENSAPPASRYRLRFHVERGIRRGSTEVHVSHDRIVGVGTELSAGVAEVGAKLTAKLADYFAHELAGTVSMVGRAIASESKAQVVKDAGGYPSLRLNVDFDRAWATVGQALQRAEVEVAESNRAEAVYRAVFPTGGKIGWLKRMVPGGHADNAVVTIRLAAEGERVIVSVQAEDGRPLAVELAERVLLTLRDFA